MDGASFLFIGLPPKTFVGINLLSFDSSSQFRGVSNIPLGFHFVYAGSDASLALRHGKWISASRKRSVFTFSWNPTDEALDLLSPSQQDTQLITPLEASGQGLIDYNDLQEASSDVLDNQNLQAGQKKGGSDTDDWFRLASHVSSAVLDRILARDSWSITSTSSSEMDIDHIPGLTQTESASILDAEINLSFSQINLKQTWQADAVGSERTEKARDRSWYLSHLIDGLAKNGKREDGAMQLLGEFQFCFLMTLTLANYSCMAQWRRILQVLLTCRTALHEVEGYFIEVLKVLKLQLEHVEDVDGGLFDLEDQENSAWLRQSFRNFGRLVGQELDDKSNVVEVWKEIENLMQEKYGWAVEGDILRRGMFELEDGEQIEVSLAGLDEEEEEGEYAPVIVET